APLLGAVGPGFPTDLVSAPEGHANDPNTWSRRPAFDAGGTGSLQPTPPSTVPRASIQTKRPDIGEPPLDEEHRLVPQLDSRHKSFCSRIPPRPGERGTAPQRSTARKVPRNWPTPARARAW